MILDPHHKDRMQQLSDEIYPKLRMLRALAMENTKDDAIPLHYPNFTIILINGGVVKDSINLTYLKEE